MEEESIFIHKIRKKIFMILFPLTNTKKKKIEKKTVGQ